MAKIKVPLAGLLDLGEGNGVSISGVVFDLDGEEHVAAPGVIKEEDIAAQEGKDREAKVEACLKAMAADFESRKKPAEVELEEGKAPANALLSGKEINV